MVKMLKKEQRSIQEGIDSRQIRGRNNKQLVLKVEITYFITGTTTTVNTREETVVAAAESNLRRQSQTVGTAFHQLPSLMPSAHMLTMKRTVVMSAMASLSRMKMSTLMLFHYSRQ